MQVHSFTLYYTLLSCFSIVLALLGLDSYVHVMRIILRKLLFHERMCVKVFLASTNLFLLFVVLVFVTYLHKHVLFLLI